MGVLIERRATLHWIHALPFGLPGAPLARADRFEAVDRAAAEALSGLQRELAAVGGLWTLYRPHGGDFDPAGLDAIAGETRLLDAWVVDLEHGIDAAWRRLDSDARYDLRLARARGLEFREEPDAIVEAYTLHLRQTRAWPGYRPLPLELSRRLLMRSTHRAGAPARLFTVRDPSGLLGAAFFLDHAREILAWWTGSRPAARAHRAMAFLYWSVVQWAHERGRLRLNLGGSLGLTGLEWFKHSLGARRLRYPSRWLDATRATLAGRIAAALQRGRGRRRYRGSLE
jgi:hypothetical protein